MAYLDKDAYLRKADYAADRMADNAKVNTLTEEQHEALAELCRMRHKMHTCHESMFNDESGDYNTLHNYFIDFYLNIDGLQSPNLETCEWESYADYCEEISDIDDNDERDRIYNQYLTRHHENKERLNRKIEEYLKQIDEKHGTEYCPGGHTRIY